MEYNALASSSVVTATKQALEAKGYQVAIVERAKDTLETIKTLIPKGASVMNGSSVTLEEIGYLEYLESGNYPWNNLHEKITAENDPAKRAFTRKQSVLSDYYLGSVHGLAQSGEFVIASNSGSQLPHVVFTSSHLIFVVGTQKIVPTLGDAMKRLKEYVFPLEDAHMKKLYNSGTYLSKIVIFNKESPTSKRVIQFILVNQKLGF